MNPSQNIAPRLAVARHGEAVYRRRGTSLGKLILTK